MSQISLNTKTFYNDIINKIVNFNTSHMIISKIILAILIVIIGIIISKIIKKIIKKIFIKTWEDNPSESLIINIIQTSIIIAFSLTALNQMGIKTESFINILSASIIGISLALKDLLSNIAATILTIANTYFKKNDYIEIGKYRGKVSEIKLFATKIRTSDNKIIYVPNSHIINDGMINYTESKIRRLDLIIGISYQENLKNVFDIINQIIQNEQIVLKNPTHVLGVDNFGDNSVNLSIQVWVKSSNTITAKLLLNRKIKEKFDEKNINMPYPQLDIHLAKK